MKRLTTLILTVLLIVPVAAPAVAQTAERNSCPSSIPRAGFSDVDPASPHAFDIDCIAWRSITDKEGTFGPSDNLPRWEMASWIRNTVLWVQPVFIGNEITFTDTGALPSEVADSIEFIRTIDITKGVGSGLYDPYGAVPRWQMALFLTRMAEATGLVLPSGEPQGFVDIQDETPEAQLAINQLAQLGITKGTGPDTFSPGDVVTREQMASFVARSLEQSWVISIYGIDCDGGNPETCSGDRSNPASETPLRIRSAGLSGSSDPVEMQASVDFWQGSRPSVELYIDGVRQVATKSLVIRSEAVYAFWEFSMPADAVGFVEIEERFLIDGQVVGVTVVNLELY